MSRNRTKPLPTVSDHAVLRWLERRYGLNIEAERIKIDRLCDTAIRAGASLVKVEGVQFLIRGGRVVTTLEPGTCDRSTAGPKGAASGARVSA